MTRVDWVSIRVPRALYEKAKALCARHAEETGVPETTQSFIAHMLADAIKEKEGDTQP